MKPETLPKQTQIWPTTVAAKTTTWEALDHLTPFDTKPATRQGVGTDSANYVCACGAQIKASITQTCTHTE